MKKYRIYLSKLERPLSLNKAYPGKAASKRRALMEFHIRQEVREACGLKDSLFSLHGNVVLADLRQVRELTMQLNARLDASAPADQFVKAGQLNAMGLIDEILHYVVALYREQVQPDVFDTALQRIEKNLGENDTNGMLKTFGTQFPPKPVYTGKSTVEQYLAAAEAGESCRCLSLEEILLLALANLNPAFKPFLFLFSDKDLAAKSVYPGAVEELKSHLASLPVFGPDGQNLWDMLRAPALASPDSLLGQLEYMRKHWGLLIGKFIARLLTSLDVIKEEEKPYFGGPGQSVAPDYRWLENEYERFSPDQDWMPRTVLIAKSTLVWLFQLSRKYEREITRLDQIPDEELDELARRGFTGLWLIGLWERSQASKTVKQWTGNPEAAASAYSLHDYDIAGELGGWDALANLRERCFRRGIRLGSDMVPNHTGLDSKWIMENPDRFLQLTYPPFPTYTYNGGNLSNRDGVGIYLEDHYYNRSDCAVVFKRVDFNSGETRYIYHGNDGTSMPWNDTAQIDFLNPEAREAVIRTIIGVCQQFSIVRFDAAMTLAKRHIQRLWYPEPGRGGDIATRAEHAISNAEFNRRIPNEFWREVVDRCATDAPHTLLLAEAFWMMEGYFVRTLGMHRVYNSAFMNMLKNEENAKYRATIKNTLEFDPEVLKRFVNFMNNPDEDTAVAQFGKGDKYFGIATLLVTMPGLPMFGHGQIEGFEEKYGMEYRRSYKDEKPDGYLVDRHEREIFPLMKKRYIFSGSAGFVLYDLVGLDGTINENVFAYSNRADKSGDVNEEALIFYNNSYYQTAGWIRRGAVAIPQKDGTFRQDDLCTALCLHNEDRYFTVLREQRSGLWYLRSSKELAERGLFVQLNGYEAQVFVDISEMADEAGAQAGSWNARWARLNHELNGRGVRDLNHELLEIFLRELYTPLEAIFSPERMEIPAMELSSIENSSAHMEENPAAGTVPAEMSPNIKIALYIESFCEPFIAFVEAAKKFISGVQDGYEAFESLKGNAKIAQIDPQAVWMEFEGFLRRTLSLADLSKKTMVLGGGLPEQGIMPIIGYGILSLLRSILGGSSGAEAVLLAEHWQLFKKLEMIFESRGIGSYKAARIMEIARAVLVRTAPEAAIKSVKSSKKSQETKPDSKADTKTVEELCAAIILENYDADDFRQLLGINRFDGVTWFNKESFDESLYWASRLLLPESDSAFGKANANTPEETEKRASLILAINESLKKAEDASEYRMDGLVEALLKKESPKKPKAAKKKTDTPKG